MPSRGVCANACGVVCPVAPLLSVPAAGVESPGAGLGLILDPALVENHI